MFLQKRTPNMRLMIKIIKKILVKNFLVRKISKILYLMNLNYNNKKII